jgi:UDP-glucose 4-epimerase
MPINSSQHILIVGGAGYIGAHMVEQVRQAGHVPIVLDDLSTGHQDALLGAECVVGSMQDTDVLQHIFKKYPIAAVMHFASFIQVGESVKQPGKYYQNNVSGTLNLLNAMIKANVKYFIFSSTAAVYGEPCYVPIDENHPISPINPYGRSKWMVEQILQDFAVSDQLKFMVLRYFNAAGADPSGRLSERHDPETHLIPLVLQVASGTREAITVYGQDYPTQDGTCVRDYVHVVDLCTAHLLALEALWQGAKNNTYNLGTGHGYSVQQVIETAESVTQRPIPIVKGPRRQGDPAVLVADAARVMQDLKWTPQYADLRTIIQHAWIVGATGRSP